MKGVYDSRGAPEEYSGVPEELARLEEHLGKLEVGLLGEGLDLEYPRHLLAAYLYIAVAGIGARGGDAEGEQGVMGLDKLEPSAHTVGKDSLAGDEVVARGHDHRRLGVDGMDMVCGPGYAWGRVAARRLEQDVRGLDVGKLLAYQ